MPVMDEGNTVTEQELLETYGLKEAGEDRPYPHTSETCGRAVRRRREEWPLASKLRSNKLSHPF